jgi:hypothetical protein
MSGDPTTKVVYQLYAINDCFNQLIFHLKTVVRVLFPLLWNIYQNDIFYEVEMKSNFSMYADDHQIYCSHINPEQALCDLKKDGKTASKWYDENTYWSRV